MVRIVLYYIILYYIILYYIILYYIILYYIILYYIILLWDRRRLFGPSLTETSLCGAYMCVYIYQRILLCPFPAYNLRPDKPHNMPGNVDKVTPIHGIMYQRDTSIEVSCGTRTFLLHAVSVFHKYTG